MKKFKIGDRVSIDKAALDSLDLSDRGWASGHVLREAIGTVTSVTRDKDYPIAVDWGDSELLGNENYCLFTSDGKLMNKHPVSILIHYKEISLDAIFKL